MNHQLSTTISDERGTSALERAGLHGATPADASSDHLTFHDLLLLCLRSRDEFLWTEFIRRSQPVIAGVVVKTVRRWTTPTGGGCVGILVGAWVAIYCVAVL